MTAISNLKDLTQTTYDSVEGYRRAIDKAESAALKSALERRLSAREMTLRNLNNALEGRGEERIDSTSMSGKAHHTFLGIADAFADGNDAAVERVEEGEDYLVGEFKDAMDGDLGKDADLRGVVEQAYQEVREGERFSDMLEKQYS